MLALIALANVPFWIAYFPETPQAGHAVLEAMNGADQWWYLARTVLVDRRASRSGSVRLRHGDHGVVPEFPAY